MEWLSSLLAAVLALVLVPGARSLACHMGLVDVPGGHKAHGRAVPLLGGPAVLAAVAVSLAVVQREALGWLVLPGLLAILGLVDDLRGVRALVRLGVELAGCWILLEATGTRLWAPPFVPGWLTTVVTAVWLVGVINAFNCIDCVDGSAAGVGTLAGLGVAAVAVGSGEGSWIAALALAGALAAFWIYNRPPATVFLGDAGSLPVGLLVGWLAVRVASEQPAAYTIAAVLVVSVPVFDFLAVHLRRWRRYGWRRLMESVGQEHLPQRLLLWRGSWPGLLALYGLQSAASLAAVGATSFLAPWPGLAVLSVWVALLLWVHHRLPVPAAAVENPKDRRAVQLLAEGVG